MKMFADRADAGQALTSLLRPYIDPGHTLVLALPRGGVPVAYEVADALSLPLDVFIVRKLGAPQQPEFALGALASGDTVVINPEALTFYDDIDAVLKPIIARERIELQRREQLYRHDLPPLDVAGQIVIVVDDGVATGSTMLAALRALHQMHVTAVIAAIPVCAREARIELAKEADRVVCIMEPEPFIAVGRWYRYFDQTSDEEVCALLARARQRQSLQRSNITPTH